jgi:hypothetical protein
VTDGAFWLIHNFPFPGYSKAWSSHRAVSPIGRKLSLDCRILSANGFDADSALSFLLWVLISSSNPIFLYTKNKKNKNKILKKYKQKIFFLDKIFSACLVKYSKMIDKRFHFKKMAKP